MPENTNSLKITYEESRNIAHNGDDQARASLASRSDIKPEILYFLAGDTSSEVRLNLAGNEKTPRLADVTLAQDKEENVRIELAGKIARLMPDLAPDEQDRVYQATIETLEILAQDQAVKVRQILAETLKDVAHVPASVIGRLARDTEIVVSEPILSFSPVLSDEDLMDIIASNPTSGAVDAISKRGEVSEGVADAIINSGEFNAIALLLGNTSAQIREETLDVVIERASEFPSWHQPLVERPSLPAKAAISLARFVAGSLISILHKRGDIEDKYISEITQIVEERVVKGSIDEASIESEYRDPDWANKSTVRTIDDEVKPEPDAKPEEEEEDDLWLDEEGKKRRVAPNSPLAIAQNQMNDGELDEAAVAAAVGRGDVDMVLANIAVMSELDMEVIEKAADAISAKSVMAVCWKAGLSAKLAQEIQSAVAGLKGDQIIPAKNGKYPFSNDEMTAELKGLKDA